MRQLPGQSVAPVDHQHARAAYRRTYRAASAQVSVGWSAGAGPTGGVVVAESFVGESGHDDCEVTDGPPDPKARGHVVVDRSTRPHGGGRDGTRTRDDLSGL